MKILTSTSIFRKHSGLGARKTSMHAETNPTSLIGRLIRIALSAALMWALASGLLYAPVCWARPHMTGPRRAAFRGFGGPQNHGGGQHAGGGRAEEPRGEGGRGARPGQEHLPAWWAAHRNLSPEQQADALRREPGFRNLPPEQQQRLLNRLHTFDQRSPEQQQRMMERNEMFERLSPERQQEVRGAAQALSQMSPDRQAALRRAFHQLKGMPPEQRQQMLNSSYGSQFSPQERTVLGNMLSIEPYQPQVAEPYFGRP